MKSVNPLTIQPAAGASATNGWLRALALTAPIARTPERILPVVIDERATTSGDAPALVSEHESFSYRILAERANAYAHWALRQGIQKGDVVCLLMPNRPEYMAIWLGVTRIGGVVSLLNTNLMGAALAHCIDIVEPTHIIVASELLAPFSEARPLLTSTPAIWSHGANSAFPDIARDLADGPNFGSPAETQVTTNDLALYIYTSGTTGWPKAARVSHYRLMAWSCWFAGMMDMRPSDRMYNCLPMYHSVGGVVATGAVLLKGGSVAIREKFSAHRFWNDVVEWDCTLFQYIGELCRYLVNAPAHPREGAHRLRLCCGNGLRSDVWDDFKSRFRIPQILEFYAATEGNVTMFNYEGKPGAIGRTPPFLAHRSPIALVKFDLGAAAPVRDQDGHCIACKPDEIGEAIGKIAKMPGSPGVRFEGYTSESESNKKILRDVFDDGDAWFRTGDLMRKDEAGYFYFVDRIGDTFRWKGENVSTSEVAEVLTAFPGVAHATVYGVSVPGYDGSAGMAAIVSDGALDLDELHTYLAGRLPAYARPLFLRMMPEIAITSTFKSKKSELSQEGFDPTRISDPLYAYDGERQAYVRMDMALYARIQSRAVRF